MSIPAITREYNPGSQRNSRKTMRLPPQQEMRHNSPSFSAEQLHVSNQTWKEHWFAWWNSRESPTTASQVSNDTDVTKGMWNCLVYPNQLEMMRDPPVLELEQSPIPRHTRQVACLTWATPEIPWDTCLKSRGTPISAQELEVSFMDSISSRG